MPSGPNRSQLHPWSVVYLELYNLPGIGFVWKDMEQALRQITEGVSLLEYQVKNGKLICNSQLRKSKVGPQGLCLTT